MKILKKQIVSEREAARLIEAYYAGETSAAEEQQLAAFLAQDRSGKYEAEQAMFGYFSERKPKRRFHLPAAMRAAAAAVAVLLLAGGLFFSKQSQTQSFAWVDGEKISSKKEIRALALAGVQGFAAGQQYDIESDLQFVIADDIIESQLELFIEH